MAACRDCRFYVEMEDARANRGQCHRYPPRPTAILGFMRFETMPRVEWDDWCGEFAAIAAESERKG